MSPPQFRTPFTPLAQNDFRTLAHAGSLKGLLRAFKGKGELTAWGTQCQRLRADLIDLAQHRVLAQATTYPLGALRVHLTAQTTDAGTMFLRWRNVERTAMGVALWEDLIGSARTPPSVLPDLLAIELQRIALNMQISLTHSLARQALGCADKMARAEAIYLRRTGHFPSPP